MATLVVTGATLSCPFGQGTTSLIATSQTTVMADNKPVATLKDAVFPTNIPPFPLCMSTSNPTVIAATAAALGVFTPAACVPQFAGPWIPEKPNVSTGGSPCLTSGCKLQCAWGGQLSIINPGQTKVNL